MLLAIDRGDLAARALTFDDRGSGWALPLGEVHVWRASLVRPATTVARMRSLLAADELARADRFRFERDRSRYIVGRALLRGLLANYLQTAPEDLTFEYGEFDKPALNGGPWFNLSHSGAVAVYAFNSAGEIGIDVERDDGDFTRERIAERFFSPAEVSVLRSLPVEDQPRAFLACWTRKEAFIKARGDGLNLALDSFDVTLAPDAPAALLRTAWCSEEPGQWRMEDLSDHQAGYIAAVAIRGQGWHVVERQIVETNEGSMPGQE
ncbi:MAG TPA: 4'-phosphopantetheinyl transferase superfamily protein [Solirubrobacteraceae bacterium]|nr:4'-phosphopantetheinyl transferase superfamily protein [Solirubrobacteraceae bacterium]